MLDGLQDRDIVVEDTVEESCSIMATKKQSGGKECRRGRAKDRTHPQGPIPMTHFF